MDDTTRNINMGKEGVSSGLFNASYAQGLAQTHYLENLRMNASKKASEAARKKLYDHLSKSAAADFSFVGEDRGGNPVTLNVVVSAPVREIVDISKLVEEVGAEEAIKVCTASRAAVESAFGKTTAAHCGMETRLTENVSVKPAK